MTAPAFDRAYRKMLEKIDADIAACFGVPKDELGKQEESPIFINYDYARVTGKPLRESLFMRWPEAFIGSNV